MVQKPSIYPCFASSRKFELRTARIITIPIAEKSYVKSWHTTHTRLVAIGEISCHSVLTKKTPARGFSVILDA